MEKVGFISLTSGVFAGVLKSIQFTGLFHKELGKIVTDTKHLEQRSDLAELWKKVCKIIYSKKFPKIGDILEDKILATYFTSGTNHYNEDVVITIIIHELTDDLIINYTQITDYFAVLDSIEKESEFKFTSTLTNEESVNEINELLSLQIDGKELADTIEPDNNHDLSNGTRRYSISYPLKGKDRTKIHQKMNKRYSLKGENYKLLRFNTMARFIDVTVSYPEDKEVSFFGVGLIEGFEELETTKGTLRRRHIKDLILPKQGFGLSFNKT